MKKKILLHCPAMKKLADEVIRSTSDISLGSIKWEKFPDGKPKLFIENARDLADKDVIFLASFMKDEEMIAELCVLYALPSFNIRSLKVILPYFSTGTMDRVDVFGQIVTAKSMARMLSAIPLTNHGPAQIVIFDIHSMQEQFFFSDQVRVRLLSAMSLIERRMRDRINPAICFPDDGAFKRFHHLFSNYDQIICLKVRDGDKRKITIKEGNPNGKNIMIVDDLFMSGGTMEECWKTLMAAGARSASTFATHAVFPNKSWEKLNPDMPIITTDSCPETIDLMEKSGFIDDDLEEGRFVEVISLAPLIADL